MSGTPNFEVKRDSRSFGFVRSALKQTESAPEIGFGSTMSARMLFREGRGRESEEGRRYGIEALPSTRLSPILTD